MTSLPLRVRLIGKANGVGLARDLELLTGALRAAGCEVTPYGCERYERRRRRSTLTRLAARARRVRGQRASESVCDVNVMLEHIWPQFLHQAPCNVLVPNPEWFDRRDQTFLGAIDRVWAKTAAGEQVFAARGLRCSQIGFDSEDRYLPEVARRAQFLHLAGRSPLKGTERLLSLWQRHPEWPTLTLVQDAAPSGAAISAANIVQHRGYLSDEELRVLQNAHRFHLCTSEAEGWGHYIVEAMSVAAVTLTCDAAPMNELVSAQRGLLIAAHTGARHNLATVANFDEASLQAQMRGALGMNEAQLTALGSAARTWFLDNKRGFNARVQRAVADIISSMHSARQTAS